MNFHVRANYFSFFNDKKQLIPETLQWNMQNRLQHAGDEARTLYVMLGAARTATRDPEKGNENIQNSAYKVSEKK